MPVVIQEFELKPEAAAPRNETPGPALAPERKEPTAREVDQCERMQRERALRRFAH